MDLDFGSPFGAVDRFRNADFRYNSLKITKCAYWDKQAVKIMTKYAKDLRRLQLNYCEFDSVSFPFTNIFGSLDKLETLTICDVGYEKSFHDSEPIKFDHLKTVFMRESSFEVRIKVMKYHSLYIYLILLFTDAEILSKVATNVS